ncbi:DUF1801 domain-containing protein [Actinophytocola sp. NPDC049390]|uniref:DUF1801 domain-containing protein n=1 Tax=Actinophytocola sp. NPDC049390 TaxID=3363894 RepID=UPI00378D3003
MTVDEWLDARPDAAPLADLVRRTAELDEAVKWNRLTFTANGDWHHWVCAVAATGTAVYLVFHKGSLLADPAGLLTGDGKYTRQVPAAQALAAPGDVAGLVRDALAHQTDP